MPCPAVRLFASGELFHGIYELAVCVCVSVYFVFCIFLSSRETTKCSLQQVWGDPKTLCCYTWSIKF